jgi:septum site-determining protein MinC
MKELIFFKGTKNGIQIILDEKEEFEKVFERLEEKLEKSSIFFVNSPLSLVVGERKLEEEELKRIENLLKEKFGFNLVGIEKEVKEEKIEKEEEIKKQDTLFEDKKIKEVETIFIKKTLRSGQSINHSGNVVILGDVNPGAEVIASGDIVIFGALRGFAHAGVNGNREARIYALKFQATQLKISEFSFKSEEKKQELWTPQVAKIEKDRIVIENI